MSKHTPGPWSTDEQDHDAPYQDIKIRHGAHRTVCTVWIDDAPVHDFNTEQEANARLIAAAPDLLEALQGFLYWSESRGPCGDPSLQKLARAQEGARAAIAKAVDGR